MLFNLILLVAGGEGGGGGAGGEAPQQPGGGIGFFLMVGAIIVVFYFFMIRPQQRRQKQEQKFREALGKGDRITTIGGIHGRIVSIDDNSALVEVDNGVKIRFDKAALKPVPESGETKK